MKNSAMTTRVSRRRCPVSRSPCAGRVEGTRKPNETDQTTTACARFLRQVRARSGADDGDAGAAHQDQALADASPVPGLPAGRRLRHEDLHIEPEGPLGIGEVT